MSLAEAKTLGRGGRREGAGRPQEIVNCILLAQREDFRIAQYSVQSDHAHLLVEADDERALTSGIQGFTIRVAKRLDSRVLERSGSIWADRFHRRDLRTPTEVRNALVYVLANGAKHGDVARGALDPCSSARWLDGWVTPLPPCPLRSAIVPARTWLLREGWKKVQPGYLFPSELPKAAR